MRHEHINKKDPKRLKTGVWARNSLMWILKDFDSDQQIWKKINHYSLSEPKDDKVYGFCYSTQSLIEGEQVEFEYEDESAEVNNSNIEELFNQLIETDFMIDDVFSIGPAPNVKYIKYHNPNKEPDLNSPINGLWIAEDYKRDGVIYERMHYVHGTFEGEQLEYEYESIL